MAGSRKLTIAGLILLAPVACWWLIVAYANPGIATLLGIGIMPPLALAVCTLKRTRNWSGITALGMIVYAVLGMMDMVALSGASGASIALGVIAVANFFLVLDAGRRAG